MVSEQSDLRVFRASGVCLCERSGKARGQRAESDASLHDSGRGRQQGKRRGTLNLLVSLDKRTL